MAKAKSIPRAPSPGEETFALHCRASLHPVNQPVREYRFSPTRKWRFDFAFPQQKVAVEIEGGVFANGRHNRGFGFETDMEKYNAAVMLGWRVLRYSTGMVVAGLAIIDVEKILGEKA